MMADQPEESITLEIRNEERDTQQKDKKTSKSKDKPPRQQQPKQPRKKNKLEKAAETLDYVERDPKQINDSCQVLFEDVIGEPEGAHTDDPVWVTVYKAYLAGKICCDFVLQYICAVPITFVWGICFSLLAFLQIYCVTPFLRAFNMCFLCFAKLYSTIVHCLIIPYAESCALFFTKIHVTNIQGTGYKDRDLNTFNLMERT